MSNKSRLQTNNINLQALIDKANALPDAGGSGGGDPEYFTVTINDMAASAGFYYLSDSATFATAPTAGTYQVLYGLFWAGSTSFYWTGLTMPPAVAYVGGGVLIKCSNNIEFFVTP